jgi:hypothetical protein
MLANQASAKAKKVVRLIAPVPMVWSGPIIVQISFTVTVGPFVIRVSGECRTTAALSVISVR